MTSPKKPSVLYSARRGRRWSMTSANRKCRAKVVARPATHPRVRGLNSLNSFIS